MLLKAMRNGSKGGCFISCSKEKGGGLGSGKVLETIAFKVYESRNPTTHTNSIIAYIDYICVAVMLAWKTFNTSATLPSVRTKTFYSAYSRQSASRL